MKGVVLAGGLGTRLKPLTDVLNKHLLPVWNRPMVYYPLEMLATAGVQDVLLVVGGQSTGDFLKLLKDGKKFGFRSLYYVYQEGEGGIAHALSLAEPFVGDDNCCVVLGDNILGESLAPYCEAFLKQGIAGVHSKDSSGTYIKIRQGARILLATVTDPENYGVPQFIGSRLKYIEEKPKHPTCNYAVIGVYFYDGTVFEKIKKLKPSDRDELEISDVNNLYAVEGRLEYSTISSWWKDAGSSIDALTSAGEQVKLHVEYNKKLKEEKENVKVVS
jgi:glucose-1-phosphate thymidylyltransferase